jgi:hypothetical protein
VKVIIRKTKDGRKKVKNSLKYLDFSHPDVVHKLISGVVKTLLLLRHPSSERSTYHAPPQHLKDNQIHSNACSNNGRQIYHPR